MDLRQQPPNRIPFKLRTALRPLCTIAVANLLNPRQMSAQVVAESARQVVDTLFFNQTIRGSVGKLIGMPDPVALINDADLCTRSVWSGY